MNVAGKRALVMGLGTHGGGLGVARFLVGQGAEVTVTDLRGPAALQPSIAALAGLPIRWVLGEHRDDDFRAADLVIRNPAVPRESRYLQLARAAGAAIEMEMTLFFRLCRGPILGITGTKGKTTTTLLAGAMLREQYPSTVVAGNLRVSALDQLPKISPTTPVVLELSSWQLEGLGEAKLSPQYACITNISADHLDRYGSMAAYAEAKRQIWLHQGEDGVLVVNDDDALSKERIWERAGRRMVCFSKRDVSKVRDSGWPAATVPTVYRYHQGIFLDDRASDHRSGPELLFEVADLRLPGEHNLSNAMAAAALARSFGVSAEAIRRAIRTFTGVEHRLELVRELDGVRYINDTTATAPEAAIAALRSFDTPGVLIAGGADKNLPFEALAQAIVERARAVVLLKGTATPKLQQAIADQVRRSAIRNLPSGIHGPFDDFAAAVNLARRLARPGDVVLLSPGCASFGMFQNEFQRGDVFRRIVQEW